MKRILVCGSNGLLGQRLALLFGHQSGYEVLNTSTERTFSLDRELFDFTQLDITNKGDVKSLVSSFRPDVVINAAAMTNVDACETERETAWKINVTGVEHLAEASRRIGAQLVHLSTDYVFDGKNGPYREEDRVNPINYYGKTKLAGENALRASGARHTILRTIVLYGTGIGVKNNFALWVVRSLRAGKAINIVDDQIANPTYVGDLATAILRVVEREAEGLYHICGAESVSRYEFGVRAAEVFGLDASLIHRIHTADLQQAAMRPMVTGFILTKAAAALGYAPMTVREGLHSLKRELETVTMN